MVPETPGGERNFLDTLRGETIGGVLLIIGAVVVSKRRSVVVGEVAAEPDAGSLTSAAP